MLWPHTKTTVVSDSKKTPLPLKNENEKSEIENLYDLPDLLPSKNI